MISTAADRLTGYAAITASSSGETIADTAFGVLDFFRVAPEPCVCSWTLLGLDWLGFAFLTTLNLVLHVEIIKTYIPENHYSKPWEREISQVGHSLLGTPA